MRAGQQLSGAVALRERGGPAVPAWMQVTTRTPSKVQEEAHAAPAGACSAADGCGGAGAGSPFAAALRSGAALSTAAPLRLLARPCARSEKPRQAPAARCSVAYTGFRACKVAYTVFRAWHPSASPG